jgi:hypothetical protein
MISFGREYENNRIGKYELPDGLVETASGEIEGVIPQCGCDGGGATTSASAADPGLIYVFGDIRPILPSQSVEKEFYQVAVTDPVDKVKPFTNSLAYKYLRLTDNFYIAREMNWVFSIRGQFDLYIIKVTNNRALSVLIETIAPYDGINYDILIAHKGGHLKKETTTGVHLPVVDSSQIYTITNLEYIAEIKKATGASDQEAANLFASALSLTSSSGDEDRQRALNFIVLRCMEFYRETYLLSKDPNQYQLVSVRAGNLEVFGKAKVLEIIFTYQSQTNSSSKSFVCTVDVSTEFPFIAVPWGAYYRGLN